MLYTVNKDENNFILSVSHTANDDTELDLDKMDLKYLNAYKMTESGAVLDEVKKALIIADEEAQEKAQHIMELWEELHSTDEDLFSFVEDIFTLKNPLTFITDLISLMTKYATLVAQRQAIRKEIGDLQK